MLAEKEQSRLFAVLGILPECSVREVLDFAEFIATKNSKTSESGKNIMRLARILKDRKRTRLGCVSVEEMNDAVRRCALRSLEVDK